MCHHFVSSFRIFILYPHFVSSKCVSILCHHFVSSFCVIILYCHLRQLSYVGSSNQIKWFIPPVSSFGVFGPVSSCVVSCFALAWLISFASMTHHWPIQCKDHSSNLFSHSFSVLQLKPYRLYNLLAAHSHFGFDHYC